LLTVQAGEGEAVGELGEERAAAAAGGLGQGLL
jgi:hypothetical protein